MPQERGRSVFQMWLQHSLIHLLLHNVIFSAIPLVKGSHAPAGAEARHHAGCEDVRWSTKALKLPSGPLRST